MSAASTPAKQEKAKLKPVVPGTPLFGCEHLASLFGYSTTGPQEGSNDSPSNSTSTTPGNNTGGTTGSGFQTCIAHYKIILRTIYDATPLVPQTTEGPDGNGVTSLTPNYLCLQCPTTLTEEERLKHGNKKLHRFYVDSRSGSLYCQKCDDFVWDPTLEELRIRKMGTGSFSARKRKHELFADSSKDDARFVASNTVAASCRANGLRGIYNAGATCYQNVVLQSFLHNPLLRNFYLGDGHQENACSHSNCLSCAMDVMFQEFFAVEQTSGYTAANILSGFWISEKKAFENLVTTKEQDAHEFFQFLAEELHERNGDGRRPETGSEHSCNCIIHQTFYGKLQQTTTCQSCNRVISTVQSFLDLNLGLETLVQKRIKKTGQKSPVLSLQDCLEEEYVKSDKCEYRCTSCESSQHARRNTSIKLLPNVLCIQLKRFEFKNGPNKAASKINAQVQFPLELNMLPYTNRAKGLDAREKYEFGRSCMYDLLSVVVHVGEIETGHYLSYCRVGDQWFKFNDHKVVLAKKSDVLGAQAYLLFYIVRSLS